MLNPTRRAPTNPAKNSEHIITAAALRATKKLSASSHRAASANANRSMRSLRPSMDPKRLGRVLKVSYGFGTESPPTARQRTSAGSSFGFS